MPIGWKSETYQTGVPQLPKPMTQVSTCWLNQQTITGNAGSAGSNNNTNPKTNPNLNPNRNHTQRIATFLIIKNNDNVITVPRHMVTMGSDETRHRPHRQKNCCRKSTN